MGSRSDGSQLDGQILLEDDGHIQIVLEHDATDSNEAGSSAMGPKVGKWSPGVLSLGAGHDARRWPQGGGDEMRAEGWGGGRGGGADVGHGSAGGGALPSLAPTAEAAAASLATAKARPAPLTGDASKRRAEQIESEPLVTVEVTARGRP